MKGNFENIIDSDTPVLVLWYNFSLDFDDNKVMILTLLDEMKSSISDKIKILKIDIDKTQNKHFEQLYKIWDTPSLSLFHKGKLILSGKNFNKAKLIDNILDLYSNETL